jgi:hypothetical protein
MQYIDGIISVHRWVNNPFLCLLNCGIGATNGGPCRWTKKEIQWYFRNYFPHLTWRKSWTKKQLIHALMKDPD